MKMKMVFASFVLMLALMVGFTSSVEAQFTVNLNGRVTKSSDGSGIPRVYIHIVSLNSSQTYQAVTDLYGYYDIDVDYDDYVVYPTVTKNNTTFTPNGRIIDFGFFDNIDFVGTLNE